MSAKARPKAVEAWAVLERDGEMHRPLGLVPLLYSTKASAKRCMPTYKPIRVRITPAPTRKR